MEKRLLNYHQGLVPDVLVLACYGVGIANIMSGYKQGRYRILFVLLLCVAFAISLISKTILVILFCVWGYIIGYIWHRANK